MAKKPASSVLTVQEAADKLNTTPAKVRRLLRGGQLKGTQENSRWTAITSASVSAYLASAAAAPAQKAAKGKAAKSSKKASKKASKDEEEEEESEDDE